MQLMNLLAELKRRNVFKVAASYAIVAWIVLQVADTTFTRLTIPDWVVTLLIVLFLLGFPIALFIAWAFEMTPEGLKPTDEVAVANSIRAQTGHKMNHLVVGGLVVILVLVMLDAYVFDEPPAVQATAVTETDVADVEQAAAAVTLAQETVEAKSVAVLPFANLSNDPEQEYFSDGLTEELINKLSQVDELLVTGRNSSFYFKGRTEELREIGTLLGVSHILQGSVRRAGATVRISAQLMDAQKGFNLWSATYDRPMADIFAVQDEIAGEVTTALSVTMGAGQFALPGYTRNVEAWDLYLKVRDAGYQFTPESILEAVENAERAVALDPDFGFAWQMLRLSASNAIVYHRDQEQRLRQLVAEARAQVERLLPGHFLTRMNAASVEWTNHNLLQAETLMQDVTAEVGNSVPQANAQYAQFLMAVGRLEDALAYIRRARRLDPLDSANALMLASNLALMGRYDEADAEFAYALTFDELSAPLHAQKSFMELEQGRYAEARESTNKLIATRDGQLALLDHLEMGDIAGGVATLDALQTGTAGTLVRHLMAFAALFGEPARALQIAEPIMRNGQTTPAVTDIWRPTYRDMRTLPDFKAIVEELGYVSYWRATGNWPDSCRPVNDDFECF